MEWVLMSNIRIRKKEDIQKEKDLARANELRKELEKTDYQVIKTSEYQLLGLEDPYDTDALHAERQALRDEINELEKE